MNKLFKHWLMLWLLLFFATGFHAIFTMQANSTQVTALGLKISNVQTTHTIGNNFNLHYGLVAFGMLITLIAVWALTIIHQNFKKQ